MPWSHTSAMDQKTQFISDDLRDRLSGTERCELSGISRKTGYKWMAPDLHDGPRGLAARSRKPGCCPRQTPDHVVAALIALRQHHPAWGAKKRLSILEKRHPHWPGAHRIDPQDTVTPSHRSSGQAHDADCRAPDVWTADVKSHFKTGDGRYCSP
jgi:putative transposase